MNDDISSDHLIPMADPTTTELYPNGSPDGTLDIKVQGKLCFACGQLAHGSVNTQINCLTLNLTNLREVYQNLILEKEKIRQEYDALLIEIEPYRKIRKEVKETLEAMPYRPY